MNKELIKEYYKDFYSNYQEFKYYYIREKTTNEESLLIVNHNIDDVVTKEDFDIIKLEEKGFINLSHKLKVVFHLNNISINSIQNNFFINKLKSLKKEEKLEILNIFDKVNSSVFEREFFEVLFYGIQEKEDLMYILDNIDNKVLNLSTNIQFNQLDNLLNLFKLSDNEKEIFWKGYFTRNKENLTKDVYREEVYKFLINYPEIKIEEENIKDVNKLFDKTKEICQIIKVDFTKFNDYFSKKVKIENYYNFTERYINYFCLYNKIDNFMIIDEKKEKKGMTIILNHENEMINEDFIKKGLIYMLSDYISMKDFKDLKEKDFTTSFKKYKIQDKLTIKNNSNIKKI